MPDEDAGDVARPRRPCPRCRCRPGSCCPRSSWPCASTPARRCSPTTAWCSGSKQQLDDVRREAAAGVPLDRPAVRRSRGLPAAVWREHGGPGAGADAADESRRAVRRPPARAGLSSAPTAGSRSSALRAGKPAVAFYTTWGGTAFAHVDLTHRLALASGVPFHLVQAQAAEVMQEWWASTQKGLFDVTAVGLRPLPRGVRGDGPPVRAGRAGLPTSAEAAAVALQQRARPADRPVCGRGSGLPRQPDLDALETVTGLRHRSASARLWGLRRAGPGPGLRPRRADPRRALHRRVRGRVTYSRAGEAPLPAVWQPGQPDAPDALLPSPSVELAPPRMPRLRGAFLDHRGLSVRRAAVRIRPGYLASSTRRSD